MVTGETGSHSSLWHLRKVISRRLRWLPEGLLVQLGWWVVPRLSRRSVLALAALAGRVMGACDRRSRRIVHANLDLVYGPPESKEERARLVRAIHRHAALVVLDFFWFSRRSRERVLQYVAYDEGVAALMDGSEAAIVVTGHLGTWELAPQVVAAHGRRVTSVYASIGGRFTQRRMRRMREANGQHLVPRAGAAVGLLRAIHDREIVGLLLDQYTSVAEGGVFVDFLGRKAPISKVAGTLSVRRQVPVHIARCRHLGDGSYRAEVLQTLAPGHGLDELQVTQWVADALGEAIRGTPEQWFWMYRRWRHVPPGADPATYPFYARPFNPACD